MKRLIRDLYVYIYKKYYNVLYCLSEKRFLEKKFYSSFGYKIDWENPKTYSEKLQWLKLYWKNPLQIICADKYAVRKYVEQKVGADILNELYGVYDCADDIIWEDLPDKFVLKATHGSGMNIICHDKSKLDIEDCKRTIRRWQRTDYEKRSGEWLYADIPRRIICEAYMENDPNTGLTDYKFWCANGRPKMIQVDYDRYGNHKKIQYDVHWEKMDLRLNGFPIDGDVEKPKMFDKMLKYAKILSEDFPFARVDFYEVYGKIYFGEITFFPGAAFHKFEPCELDRVWGDWIQLPEKYT